MAVGIPGAGWAGWIEAVTRLSNVGVGIYACIQAALFTAMAVLSLVLLKRVSVYNFAYKMFNLCFRSYLQWHSLRSCS